MHPLTTVTSSVIFFLFGSELAKEVLLSYIDSDTTVASILFPINVNYIVGAKAKCVTKTGTFSSFPKTLRFPFRSTRQLATSFMIQVCYLSLGVLLKPRLQL
jgi:hypothetical protein